MLARQFDVRRAPRPWLQRSVKKSFILAGQFDCSGCADSAEDLAGVTVSTETQPGRCVGGAVVQRGPLPLDQA